MEKGMKPKNTWAWIACFAGWLTAKKESIAIGASEDCGVVAELVAEYCTEQKLPEAEWECEVIEQPKLGLATTRQLFDELGARMEIDGVLHQGCPSNMEMIGMVRDRVDLNYRPVDSE